nr:MAG TPA: hypothetical protein [Bacteriophage sp.]
MPHEILQGNTDWWLNCYANMILMKRDVPVIECLSLLLHHFFTLFFD